MTLNQPWLNIYKAHRLIILDICAELFVNLTKGSKDIERTQKCDRQTDRWTCRQTDRQADGQTMELNTVCLPILWGET